MGRFFAHESLLFPQEMLAFCYYGERSAEGCILTNGVSCFALLIGIGDKLVTNSPHNGIRCDERIRLCVQISGHNSCSWYFHRSSPCAAHS